MPRELIHVEIDTIRQAVGEFPEWQQGLPQHTTVEAAVYYLEFLKLILRVGPGLFLDDSYHAPFVTLVDAAIQAVNTGDLQGAATQIEDQILPAVTQGVVPENRIAFRDVLGLVQFIALASTDEHYFTPPLDEILSDSASACYTITGTWHKVQDKKCTIYTTKFHIIDVTPPDQG